MKAVAADLRCEMTAATHTGKVRDANEDCLRIMPDLHLAVLADGMGGHNAGEVASRMSVDALCDFYEERAAGVRSSANEPAGNLLPEAFNKANREVFAASRRLEGCNGMGTTLLAASFQSDSAHVGHIGDSRLYRFAAGMIAPLTTDHVLAAAMAAENPGAAVPSYSHHMLTKSLGTAPDCQPDFFAIRLAAGEIYLLCLDGLCDMLNDRATTAILSRTAGDPEACADALIEACLERGGRDNISLILVSIH